MDFHLCPPMSQHPYKLCTRIIPSAYSPQKSSHKDREKLSRAKESLRRGENLNELSFSCCCFWNETAENIEWETTRIELFKISLSVFRVSEWRLKKFAER